MRPQDFRSITSLLLGRMSRASKAPGNLKECSPWMSSFRAEFLRDELEVPGEFASRRRGWAGGCLEEIVLQPALLTLRW